MSQRDVSDLKRMLQRLSSLDGEPLSCVEGLHLVQVRAVPRPAALLDAVWERGGVSAAALAACCDLARPPAPVEPRWLAAVQRDLRVLERNPELRALAAESRALRRYGAVDAAALERRQAQIDALSAKLGSAPPPAGPLELVEALRGAEAGWALAAWRARSIAWGQERRRAAQRRVEALAARIRGRRGPTSDLPPEVLDAFAARLRPRAPRFAGRARDWLILEVLVECVAWPGAAPHAAIPHGAQGALGAGGEPPELPPDLAEAVEAAGARQVARIASTRHPDYVRRLERALGLLALAFRPEPSGVLTPDDVHFVLREISSPKAQAASAPLTMAQGLRLLRLQLDPCDQAAAQDRLAEGLELELLERLAAAKKLEGLHQLDDVDALRTWGRWVLDLGPRLEASGVELKLPPSIFRTEAAARDRDLALFARALLTAGGNTLEPAASRLARLDAVIALVDRAPAQARTLRAELAGTEPGAGRRLFPDFAEWLGDDELLDRYCHLMRLAGRKPAMPRALLRDFHRRAKLLGEREHLARLAAPTLRQRGRLARLEQLLAGEELSSRDWTRRHLGERLGPAQGRALEARLDAALREALEAAFGIRPPAMTPAWRDAVRFYLSTHRNRELLGRLLRFAAARPGAPITRTLPANQAWIAEAAARFDVEAWLAPRRVELVAGGRALTLAAEDDPLEVLRMGIPFDTCLSLLDGGNAASTVLNALDANKRVLYLRDSDGTVVGRKLLAVSKAHQLLGYQLYLALDPALRPELERAANALCRALAEEAGLPLAEAGAPAVIHEGFWYDDGPVPFTGPNRFPEAVERFCQSLGRPPVRCEELEIEARLWSARRSEGAEAVLGELSGFNRWDVGTFEPELGRWLVDRLGQAEALQRGGDRLCVVNAVLDRAFEESPARMLAVLAKLEGLQWQTWNHAWGLLKSAGRAAGLVRALAAAARAQCGRTPFNDHNIEHGTLWALPGLAARAPLSEMLEALDALAPVWAYVAREAPQCADCVTEAVASISAACERAYGDGPDSKAVIDCLGDPRRSEAAQRVALHLAARFPFPRVAREPINVPVGLRAFESEPLGCPSALQALKRLRERRPALARSGDFAAAVLRQSTPGEMGLELPTSEVAPYEALGDLAMHVPGAVAPLLAPWEGQLSKKPGPWELYHHRRQPTAYRRGLQRRGAQDGDAEERSALLGLIPREGGRHGRHRSTRISQIRAAVRAQVAGEDVAAGDLPSEAIDPALVRRRLAATERAEGEGLASAVRALGELALPTGLWRAITEQLLERGADGAVLALAARAWLPKCSSGLAELPPELALRLGVVPESAALVAETLGRLEPEDWPAWHARLRGIYPQPAGAEAFFQRLNSTWLSSDPGRWTALPAEIWEGLAEAALATGPAQAVRLYESAGSFAFASRLLDVMLARFDRGELARCAQPAPEQDAFLGARRAWLRAALEDSTPSAAARVKRRSPSNRSPSRA